MPPKTKRLAIIGAGPIGIEAALAARKLGLTLTVYERGRIGEHLERWGFVRLFTPFGMNSTPLGRSVITAEHPKLHLPDEDACISGREHVAMYLSPLAKCSLLDDCIKTETQVIGVSRNGVLKEDPPDERDGSFRLLLRDAKGNESFAEADAVFDCGGTYGQPCYLGAGGIPAIGELANRNVIAGGLEDIGGAQRAKYLGKTVMVIGAGLTAATHVCALADLAAQNIETWTVWLARSPRSQPLHRVPNDPFRDRDKLAVRANSLATRGEGNVEFHSDAVIDRLVPLGPDKGFQITARIEGAERKWDVERIIGSVGNRPDPSVYRELHVRGCATTEAPESTESDFYVLGAKSRGRGSSFLLRDGFEQIQSALTRLTGKSVPSK